MFLLGMNNLYKLINLRSPPKIIQASKFILLKEKIWSLRLGNGVAFCPDGRLRSKKVWRRLELEIPGYRPSSTAFLPE